MFNKQTQTTTTIMAWGSEQRKRGEDTEGEAAVGGGGWYGLELIRSCVSLGKELEVYSKHPDKGT